MDIITHAGEVVLDLEDVVICKNSSIVNKKLKDAKIPEHTGLIILAIRKNNKSDLSFNPSSDEVLEVGDIMLVLGRESQIKVLRNMACDSSKNRKNRF